MNSPAILHSMKRSALLILLAFLAFSACKSRQEHADPNRVTTSNRASGSDSGFDYYLLNLSWSPEFCYSHPDAAECSSHSTFVLHGLWPQNNDGTYPENCSNAPGPSDPSSFSDIYPDQGLLEHEWHTHGTCSGLSADGFFVTARTAFRSIAIPTELAGITSQTSMPPDEIKTLFHRANSSIPPDSFAVSCGHNYLTAVEVCLDKTLHPVACGPIHSCRANTIRIPPPR